MFLSRQWDANHQGKKREQRYAWHFHFSEYPLSGWELPDGRLDPIRPDLPGVERLALAFLAALSPCPAQPDPLDSLPPATGFQCLSRVRYKSAREVCREKIPQKNLTVSPCHSQDSLPPATVFQCLSRVRYKSAREVCREKIPQKNLTVSPCHSQDSLHETAWL